MIFPERLPCGSVAQGYRLLNRLVTAIVGDQTWSPFLVIATSIFDLLATTGIGFANKRTTVQCQLPLRATTIIRRVDGVYGSESKPPYTHSYVSPASVIIWIISVNVYSLIW